MLIALDQEHALTSLIALQFGIYAAGWALSGALLRDPRSPLGNWAGFMG